MWQIKKRDNTIVDFDKNKIIKAINSAMKEVDGELFEEDTAIDIANDIEKDISNNREITTVEDIQNMVEDYLMRSERKDVARAYIRYRYKRETARENKSTFFEAIGEKLEARNVQNQNANVDEYSFGGRVGEAASVMTKQYALDNLVSKMARDNYLNNEIYIHDLDAYAVGSHNCLSIPFDDLLKTGFNTRQTDVRPANSINTAFQLIAVIFQLQSLQQFGGVSATHLDWTMVPYVRKSFYKHYKDGMKYFENIEFENFSKIEEKSIESKEYSQFPKAYDYAMEMTQRELKQAVEGMYHNLK